MRDKCVAAANRIYPELTDDEAGELLVSATSFPFGSPKLIEQQLIQAKTKSDGTLGGAMAYADEEMERAAAEWRAQQ